MRKVVSMLLVTVMCCGFLVGCGEKNNQKSDAVSLENSEKIPNTEDVLEKIDVNVVATEEGTMCAFITNNSDTIVDELKVQINYKDANGTTIDVKEDGHDMVLPGSVVVSRIDKPENYVDFEVEKQIELGKHPKYENHSKDIQLISNEGEKGVIVEITNNSAVSISEIEIIAVLYNGETIVEVTYPKDIMNVQAGQKITEKIDTFGTEYDRFEVYLNQAHTFGF